MDRSPIIRSQKVVSEFREFWRIHSHLLTLFQLLTFMSANEKQVEDHAQKTRHNTLRGNVRWPKNIYEVLYTTMVCKHSPGMVQNPTVSLYAALDRRCEAMGYDRTVCGRQRLTCQAQLLFSTSGWCGGAGQCHGPPPSPRVLNHFCMFRTVFYFVGTWNICVENLHRLVCGVYIVCDKVLNVVSKVSAH